MKTDHTDEFGLLPWAFTVLSIASGFFAMLDAGESWRVWTDGLASLVWAGLAVREFRRRAKVRREGGDPSIVRSIR